MQVNWSFPVIGIGWILALIILIVVIVLLVIGQISMLEGLLIGGLALARLL